MIPIAFLFSGPLLVEGGAWANTIIGNIFGVGCGAGLMFGTSGILLAIVSVLIFLNPCVRNIENEFPDIEVEEEEIVQGDAVLEGV